MSVADFILSEIITFMNFGLDTIPREVPFFTLSDLNTLLNSLSNFWTQSFSISSHFLPFGLLWFFILPRKAYALLKLKNQIFDVFPQH